MSRTDRVQGWDEMGVRKRGTVLLRQEDVHSESRSRVLTGA